MGNVTEYDKFVQMRAKRVVGEATKAKKADLMKLAWALFHYENAMENLATLKVKVDGWSTMLRETVRDAERTETAILSGDLSAMIALRDELSRKRYS